MASFNMERCTNHTQQLITKRYPQLDDRVKALLLQIKIGTAFGCDEAPSIDPADTMLPTALRLLADSLECEHTIMLQEDTTAGSEWD